MIPALSFSSPFFSALVFSVFGDIVFRNEFKTSTGKRGLSNENTESFSASRTLLRFGIHAWRLQ